VWNHDLASTEQVGIQRECARAEQNERGSIGDDEHGVDAVEVGTGGNPGAQKNITLQAHQRGCVGVRKPISSDTLLCNRLRLQR
jgi:hypothetical protein